MIADPMNIFMLVTTGFAKTFGAMEAAWKIGKSSDKRGEKKIL